MTSRKIDLNYIRSKRGKKGQLFVKDKEIEEFAYNQLRSFDPNYFQKPKPLPVDEFVRFVTGKEVFFTKLSDDGRIYGLTAKEKNLGKVIFVDEQACHNNYPPVVNFTILHETWHFQVDLDYPGKNGLAIKVKLNKGLDMAEHQANKYATYLLLPEPFIVQKFNEFKTSDDIKSLTIVTRRLSKFFVTSKEAVIYRLQEVELIDDKTKEDLISTLRKRAKRYLEKK